VRLCFSPFPKSLSVALAGTALCGLSTWSSVGISLVLYVDWVLRKALWWLAGWGERHCSHSTLSAVKSTLSFYSLLLLLRRGLFVPSYSLCLRSVKLHVLCYLARTAQ
jgi:hypothetical protein